ncbi:hypothetical protein A1OQ_01010 [Enterovibrio norvegicus FF-162]|uniref:hypothetical protein n=1 Tax=Enterovibrio norvegicus TaxID=188144 RepID=UPI0002D7F734|nr:hypothetical protein [Enterovibrio norvegicus]OEE75169.1 hypothetical protein A1OQ_01010 [Enterovibrio norvegicus FF-162]
MLRKSVVAVAILGMLAGFFFYEKEPSFMDFQRQGPSTLTYFFQNEIPSENSPDPYISSLYRPGDPLYQPILDFQNGRKYLAIPKLKELSEAGNSDAMFWYAHNRMTQSIKTRYEGYNWFEKSAKLGNPYSALILDTDSYYCNAYFPSLCSKEWGELAQKSFKKRAAAGDIRAKYYLERPTKFVRGEDFKKWVALVEEYAKKNEFAPVMDMLSRFESNKKLSEDQREDLLHVYRFLAKYNFVPAYNALYTHSRYETIFSEAIKLGSKVQLEIETLRCVEISETLPTPDLVDCLSKAYTLQELFNEPFSLDYIVVPDDPELVNRAKEKSRAFIETMTPTIYIDEMHIEGYR